MEKAVHVLTDEVAQRIYGATFGRLNVSEDPILKDLMAKDFITPEEVKTLVSEYEEAINTGETQKTPIADLVLELVGMAAEEGLTKVEAMAAMTDAIFAIFSLGIDRVQAEAGTFDPNAVIGEDRIKLLGDYMSALSVHMANIQIHDDLRDLGVEAATVSLAFASRAIMLHNAVCAEQAYVRAAQQASSAKVEESK